MATSYQIRYHSLVVKEDIPQLDKVVRERIKQAIERKLMTAPETFGVPLRRSLKGYRKLRVGDYRAVFRLTGRTVYILAIRHRRIVYDYSEQRSKFTITKKV